MKTPHDLVLFLYHVATAAGQLAIATYVTWHIAHGHIQEIINYVPTIEETPIIEETPVTPPQPIRFAGWRHRGTTNDT